VRRGHVPVRQCVACRRRLEKDLLRRFVQQAGQWLEDPAQRAPGRGVYVCSPECAQHVAKNKRYRTLAPVAQAVWVRSNGDNGNGTSSRTG